MTVVTIKESQGERFIREGKVVKLMAKPVHLTARVLEDEVVLDGIRAINVLKEAQKLPGRIAGGMAVQGYTPSDTHRGTIDLDFSLIWNGSCTDYKSLCKPLIYFLQEKGYEVEFRKKGFAYEALYHKEGQGKEGAFMIQHPHRSEHHYSRIRRTLEREVSNQRIVTRGDLSFESLSPEDLIVTKMNRILVFSNKYGLSVPKEVSPDKLLEESKNLRADIVSRAGEASPSDVAKLRMLNDMYDIKRLNESVGVNGLYLSEVLEDWDQMKSEDLSFLSETQTQ